MLLGLCLGTLVLLAAASVLVISIWSGIQSTIDLLQDQAVFAIDTVEARLEEHLIPAEDQLDFINDLIVAGRLDPNDDQQMENVLTGALAATPQVDGIIFVDTGGRLRGVGRVGGGAYWISDEYVGGPDIDALTDDIDSMQGGGWGNVVWSPGLEIAVQTIRRPVIVNGEVIGVLGVGVSIQKLSRLSAELEDDFGHRVFILQGDNMVVAHPSLADDVAAIERGLSPDKPVPLIDEVDDPILAVIWGEPTLPAEDISGTGVLSHMIEIDGEEWFYVYHRIDTFGSISWLLGSYYRGSDFEDEFERLNMAIIAGLLVLALGVAAAFYIGHRIADPVHRLAISAQHIGALEFDKVDPLARSRMRELDEANGAFNLMLTGLRWFENYVPRKLVHRLMIEDRDFVSEERDVTVMFTDIVGFTPFAESLPAAETATFLNEHFALITTCVEAEGGTVDKYIGDAVMAFWGAPEHQPDHAMRACRAATAIAEAIGRLNIDREARGEQAVHLRIGLHTGSVVVGNIGAPDRVNYTIVGDTVNTCHRLEQLGKLFDGERDSDTVVLISDATWRALDGSAAAHPIGHHEVKGRTASIEVYRLDT
ncbi:MAG: adenylate/guanylate cyclase domain-containing protein [Pseudomonadota bacterium]